MSVRREDRLALDRIGATGRGWNGLQVAEDRATKTEDGTLRYSFHDVQFDKNDGAIYAVCDAPLAHGTFRKEPLIGRVEGTRAGNRETVATFELRPT